MSSLNSDRFYVYQYNNALRLFNEGDEATADNECRKLITNILCPRLIQVYAWQLYSLCTTDYWLIKDRLERALAMFEREDMNATKVQRKARQTTEAMLTEVNQQWQTKWAERGISAPAKQNLERDANVGTWRQGDQVDIVKQEMSSEELASQYQRMEIVEDERMDVDKREDASSPVADLPGGYQEPWRVGSDTVKEGHSADAVYGTPPPTSPPPSPPHGSKE